MTFSDTHITFPKSPVLPNTPWYSLHYIGWLDAEKAPVHFPHFVSNVHATIVRTHINDLMVHVRAEIWGGIICVAEVHLSPKLLFDLNWVVTCSKWAMNLIMDHESH